MRVRQSAQCCLLHLPGLQDQGRSGMGIAFGWNCRERRMKCDDQFHPKPMAGSDVIEMSEEILVLLGRLGRG